MTPTGVLSRAAPPIPSVVPGDAAGGIEPATVVTEAEFAPTVNVESRDRILPPTRYPETQFTEKLTSEESIPDVVPAVREQVFPVGIDLKLSAKFVVFGRTVPILVLLSKALK